MNKKKASLGKFVIAEFIRENRERLNMNQKQLSEASGIPQATISRIESGQIMSPRLNVLKKLSGALKMPLDQLTGLENDVNAERVIKVDEDAKSLLGIYVELSPEKKKQLLDFARYILFNDKKNEPSKKSKKGLLGKDPDSSSS